MTVYLSLFYQNTHWFKFESEEVIYANEYSRICWRGLRECSKVRRVWSCTYAADFAVCWLYLWLLGILDFAVKWPFVWNLEAMLSLFIFTGRCIQNFPSSHGGWKILWFVVATIEHNMFPCVRYSNVFVGDWCIFSACAILYSFEQVRVFHGELRLTPSSTVEMYKMFSRLYEVSEISRCAGS